MSFLDLAQGDQEASTNYIRTHSQPRLPVNFGEGFEAAWRENQLFGQSMAGETARQQALQDHIDDVRNRTGVDLAKDIDYSGAAFGGALTADMLRETVNATAKKAGQPELSADDLEQAAVAKSRAARSDYALVGAREKGPGGGAGLLLGGLAGAATDPINVLALPVAPAEGLPLLAYALRWGAIAGASQAAIEATAAPFHEAVQPGYLASGEPLLNVTTAGAGGAVLGASTKVAVTALARAWGRVKTGDWPTSVRDAGNLAESEANIQATNVYPGAAGEAAHRDALADTVDQVVKGEPVDVAAHITPEIEASADERLTPIMEARAEARRTIATVERIPDSDFIKRIGTGETDVPTVEELQKAISATREADIASSGMDEKTYRELERLNRQIDQGSDAAIARKNEILAGLPPQGEEINLPDVDQIRQLAVEFSSLEKQSAESLPEFEDGIARVLKRYISAFTDGDDMARAVFRKAFVEAQRHGLDTKKLGNDVIKRFLGDLSESDQKFMRQEFARFLTKKIAPQPELPFEQSAAQAKADKATDALAAQIAAEAKRAGYDMTPEEAAQVAASMVKAPDEQVGQTIDRLATNPSFAAEPLPKAPKAEPEPRGELGPEAATKMLASPEHEAAIRADIDRARQMGDVKIPAGIDEKGEPVFRSVDGAMDEVDGYRAAADQIKACANPQPEVPDNG